MYSVLIGAICPLRSSALSVYGVEFCRYYLGGFKDEKYLPEFHAMMSWNGNHFFAPESMLTHDGRRVMWAWLLGMPIAPTGVQSLPRESFAPDFALEEGALIEFSAPDGTRHAGRVRELHDHDVLVDFNHPLAGRRVKFEVEVLAVAR